MKLSKKKIMAYLLIVLLGIGYILYSRATGTSEDSGSDSGTQEILLETGETADKGETSGGKETESGTENTGVTGEAAESETAKESEEKTSETERQETSEAKSPEKETSSEITVEKDGEYSDKEHVALYIHIYGELPGNYITKSEAEDLGWDSSKGNLWEVAPGKSIGGSYFGNYEGLLPKKNGRKYYECDIDYGGKYRNAKRIIYSNDGLIYYTDDHYESFELLYE